MPLRLRLAMILNAAALLVACTDAPPPVPTGHDGGRRDACAPCSPREGCRYEGGSGCECGTLVCDEMDAGTKDAGARDAGVTDAAEPAADASFPIDGCAEPECPPTPPGCEYQEATPCTCGILTCDGLCGSGECTPSQYCEYALEGSCGGDGTCQPRPTSCGAPDAPVCGCDTITYASECEAQMSGASIAFPGECPPIVDCRDGACAPGETCTDCGGVFVCLPPGAPC